MDIKKCLSKIRSELTITNYNLNEAIYYEIKEFFLYCTDSPWLFDTLAQRSSEYGIKEFFINVDQTGNPISINKNIIKDYEEIVKEHRQFGLWFTEQIDAQNNPALLVARWLSHLVGIRHRCSHVFIDHPNMKDYTIIQIRSFNKFESPGCFDIPVGGHVVGLDSDEETIRKELKEELNVGLNDFEGFNRIGAYSYANSSENNLVNNVEFRTVFSGKLKTDSLPKIKFLDKEVSAIGIFAIPELLTMISKFPKRIASGLIDSMPIYIEHNKQHGY